MSRQIVIFTGFNRAKFKQGETPAGHNTLSEDWIRYRYSIWREYTWKSIKDQVYKDWVYCFCCDPASKPIIDKVFKVHDPRFFITYSETDQERAVMRGIVDDEMVNVRVDSDDMYHPLAIYELDQEIDKVDNDWFLWQKGFGYQYTTGRLKRYRPGHGSGPFFAHRYNGKDWLNTGIIKECKHRLVAKKKPHIMPDGRIMVGLHENTSTHFWTKCFKNVIRGDRKEEILREFKII